MVVPGQRVWVRGRLRVGGGLPVVGPVDADHPVVIHTSPASRRQWSAVLVGLIAGPWA